MEKKSRKRKAATIPPFSFDELSQDLLERVLSWLPASSFLRLRSVCKRWRSVSSSPSFRLACSQIPSRDPWFLMVDEDLDQSIIYDASEGDWKKIPTGRHQIPVASSGSLVCFRDSAGVLTLRNPVTGAARELPPAATTQPLLAIAMSSTHRVIILISGELSDLSFTVLDPDKNQWEKGASLARKQGSSPESDRDDGEAVYFLNKTGDVMAANMQRNPSKEFSSVTTFDQGEEIVFFLSHSGTVVACNLCRRTFQEYPRLLPISSEYSIDLVASKGEMMAVVLSEFFETASLRIWRFCVGDSSWRQVTALPPAMSHEFYGKKADVNCVGCGSLIFVCVNSSELCRNVMYNVEEDEWAELPKCLVEGKEQEFVSAFSFEPRLEVSL